MYQVFIRTKTGEIIEAFTWTRSKNAGILRALTEAPKFGYEVDEAWAEEIEMEAA